MLRPLLHGLAAGAVGTTVLNTLTYLDMAVRARPPSSVPDDTVDRLAGIAGLDLAGDEGGPDVASARREAIGALLGYATGFGVGAAYGLLRQRALVGVPAALAGVGIGAAATVATVVPYTALGVSDPRTWSASGWAADIVPHLGYGWATAATFEALAARRR